MHTVEHFPQFRHPFVVCRPDGSRKEGFNTRQQAEARCEELNRQPVALRVGPL